MLYVGQLSTVVADFLVRLRDEQRLAVITAAGKLCGGDLRLAAAVASVSLLEPAEAHALVLLCFSLLSWRTGTPIPTIRLEVPDPPPPPEPPPLPPPTPEPPVDPPIEVPEPAVNRFVFHPPVVQVDPGTGMAKIVLHGRHHR